MKKDVKNIQASVRAQLQNKAKEANRPFAELLQYYGMERFLYRFSRSEYANKFILKGALMFTVWQVPQRRTTLDIDFSSTYGNQIATIEKVIRDVCTVSVTPDGLVFDSQTVKGQKIKEDADYEGVRIKFKGRLYSACALRCSASYAGVYGVGKQCRRCVTYPCGWYCSVSICSYSSVY